MDSLNGTDNQETRVSFVVDGVAQPDENENYPRMDSRA